MNSKNKTLTEISDNYKLLNQKFKENKNLQIFLKKKILIVSKVLRCLMMFSQVPI